MRSTSKMLALLGLVAVAGVEAAPVQYEFVTGPVALSTPGAPVFTSGAVVEGEFVYDADAPQSGTGTVPGTVMHLGAFGALSGSVQGLSFSDPGGAGVVGDEQTGTPPGTTGADLLVLLAETRGIAGSQNLTGFELGSHRLVNVRLFWLEGQSGIPDFLGSSTLPAELPEFAGRLALDFEPLAGGPTSFVFFDGMLVQKIAPPDPAELLQQLLEDVTGVGPGASLAAKVALAQTYYAVPDGQATCALLQAFVLEVIAQRGKKLAGEVADDLATDAQAIMTLIGCD